MTAVVEALPTAPAHAADRGGREARLGAPFWRLWSAAAVSNVGDGVALVAFPLAAASITSNATLVAGVAFALRLPWLLFALPAGALADRLNRGRTMAVVDAARAAVLAGLVVASATDHLALLPLFVAALALGTLETLYAAASHAALPALVPERSLDTANGYLYATETVAGDLAGPAVGGLLFAAAAGLPFFVDGATFVISALLLFGLRARLPAPPRVQQTSLRTDIADGVAYLRATPVLRLVTGLVAALAFLQSMVMGVLVLLGTQELGLTDVAYGAFFAVGAGGGIAGGLLACRVRIAVGTASSLTGAAVLAAAGYLLMALAPNPAVAAVGFALESFAVACGNVTTLSLRQSLVPDELRGRVGNVFRMCIWGGVPLGILTGGVIASGFGVRTPVLLAGLVQLALAAKVAGLLRDRIGAAESPVIDLREEAAPVAV